MDANEEFKELLARSGWNQSRAARELDLTTASVSRYMNGIDKPSPQTLRLFKIIQAGEPTVLREETAPTRLDAAQREQMRRLHGKVKELESDLLELLAEGPAVKPSSETAYEKTRARLAGANQVSYRKRPSRKFAVPKPPAPSENETA